MAERETPDWDELKDCYDLGPVKNTFDQNMINTYVDLLNKNQIQYTNCKALIKGFKDKIDKSNNTLYISGDQWIYRVKKVQCGGATKNTFKLRITIRIEPGKGNPMYPAPTEPPKMKEEIKYLKDFLQNVFPEMDMMVPINKVLQG